MKAHPEEDATALAVEGVVERAAAIHAQAALGVVLPWTFGLVSRQQCPLLDEQWEAVVQLAVLLWCHAEVSLKAVPSRPLSKLTCFYHQGRAAVLE